MSTKSVYLAGPIGGLTFRDAVEWRQEVVRQFYEVEGSVEIIGMSPLRYKDFLDEEGVLHCTDDYPHVLCGQRGITTRDFYDVRTCDVLFVNFLGAKSVSIGTSMEIAVAHQTRTPIVVAMENEGNLHDHPILRECIDFRVDTLEEAIHTTITILTPGYKSAHFGVDFISVTDR